jgi:hypothetical protein
MAPTNRSKLTYNKQGGKIKSLTFCETGTSLAACSGEAFDHLIRKYEHLPENEELKKKF